MSSARARRLHRPNPCGGRKLEPAARRFTLGRSAGQSKRAPSHPLERPGKNRHELSEIRNYSVIGRPENIRFSVIINGHNKTRSLNPDRVIEGSAHTDSKIKLWSDCLSGKSDLLLAREPARVDDTSACANRHTGFRSRRGSRGPA